MNEDYIKKLKAMNDKLGDNVYYTIKNSEGALLPRAILESSDGYGREAVEAWLAKHKKEDCTLATIEIKEL